MKKENLKVKDLVNIGLLSALFVVIFFIVGAFASINPITFIFKISITAIPAGTIFILLLLKIKKSGVYLISSIVLGILMTITGHMWFFATLIILCGIITEIFYYFIDKENYFLLGISYTIFMSLLSVAYNIPLKIYSQFFIEKFKSMDNGVSRLLWFEKLLTYLRLEFIPILLGVTIIFSIIGFLIGKKLLNKHFIKSGIINN